MGSEMLRFAQHDKTVLVVNIHLRMLINESEDNHERRRARIYLPAHKSA